MSAIPNIPDHVREVEQLDAWINSNAAQANTMAKRLRLAVAVMDRASEIGQAQRAKA